MAISLLQGLYNKFANHSENRYLMVCHARAMLGREKEIANQILRVSIMTPCAMSFLSLLHREHTFQVLFCMGRMEQFYYHLRFPFSNQIGGAGITLKFFHPFRISVNVFTFSFFIVVPVLYSRIFKFRKSQDELISGKTIINQHTDF